MHHNPVPETDLPRVHTRDYVESVRSLCERGGGHLDPETFVSAGSFDAALGAAGAGIDMVDALRNDFGRPGFVAVHPPDHHGNGTQQMFWDDPSVMYISIHQTPLFPDSGPIDDTGGAAAPKSTVNVPLPAGATGDVYSRILRPGRPADRAFPTRLNTRFCGIRRSPQ